MMLKLKLQYFGHLMWRVDSLEKTVMLGGIGGRKRGQQRMRWLDDITDSMGWVWVSSGSWWWTVRPGVLQFMGLQRVGYDWATELNWSLEQFSICCIFSLFIYLFSYYNFHWLFYWIPLYLLSSSIIWFKLFVWFPWSSQKRFLTTLFTFRYHYIASHVVQIIENKTPKSVFFPMWQYSNWFQLPMFIIIYSIVLFLLIPLDHWKIWKLTYFTFMSSSFVSLHFFV